MKTKQTQNNLKRALQRILGMRETEHDPMLVLNMSFFNETDGLSRTFSKDENARHRF